MDFGAVAHADKRGTHGRNTPRLYTQLDSLMTRRIQESNSDDGRPDGADAQPPHKREVCRGRIRAIQRDDEDAFLCEPCRPFMLPIIIENDVTVRAREIGFLGSVYTFLARKALSGG